MKYFWGGFSLFFGCCNACSCVFLRFSPMLLSTTCRFGSVSQTKPTGGRSQRFVCRSIGGLGGFRRRRSGTNIALGQCLSTAASVIHSLGIARLFPIQILGAHLCWFFFGFECKH